MKTKKYTKKKKSILHYKEIFTEKEIKLIQKNLLVNEKNINYSENEIFLQSGLILKTIYGTLYTQNDPLLMNSIYISFKIFTLLSPCIHSIVSNIINNNNTLKKLIDKKFKRFININVNQNDTNFISDIIFQLKILKMIFNENFDNNFKYLNNKKNIKIINELIEFRNLLSHQAYKKQDHAHQYSKRSILLKNNKLRNYNYIINIIHKIQFLLNDFYINKDKIKLNSNIFKRCHLALNNIIETLKILCLIRERRKRLQSLIKNEKQLHDIALETITFLHKKLNSKNKQIRNKASRNIVNLILPRFDSDIILKKIDKSLSNKSCKKYCKLL